jgi:putative salt-induced outer membrane protein
MRTSTALDQGTRMPALRTLVCAALATGAAGLVQAQATVKPDGQWRAVFGLGLSNSSGNTDSTNLSMTGDAVRATDLDKWAIYLNSNYARSASVTNTEQIRLGGRYERNFNPAYFGYGGLDLEKNRFANLEPRSMLTAGIGWHVIKSLATTFDVFGGLGYTADKYRDPMVIGGELRDSYNYASLPLGEESTHKLTATTSARQRLVVVANLKDTGEYRATWDAGLAVAMAKGVNLTLSLAALYNSDPGLGRKSTDTLLTTGIAVKFD